MILALHCGATMLCNVMARHPRRIPTAAPAPASAAPTTCAELLAAAEHAVATATRAGEPPSQEDAWGRCIARDRASAAQRLVAVRSLLPAIERGEVQALATAATLAIEAAHTAASLAGTAAVAVLARRLGGDWSEAVSRRPAGHAV